MAAAIAQDVLATLERAALVPVVTLDDPAKAAPLVQALLDGGIRCAEFVLRTTSALAAIEAASAEAADFEVGAGTVISAADVDRACAAGATFLVSPGLGFDVVERATSRDVALIPGVGSATDAQAAVRAGITHAKVFPANLLGGVKFIDALSGPFPSLRFLPSGGIDAHNARDYLDHPSVFAVAGSWTVPSELLATGDFDAIRQLAHQATELMVASDV